MGLQPSRRRLARQESESGPTREPGATRQTPGPERLCVCVCVFVTFLLQTLVSKHHTTATTDISPSVLSGFWGGRRLGLGLRHSCQWFRVQSWNYRLLNVCSDSRVLLLNHRAGTLFEPERLRGTAERAAGGQGTMGGQWGDNGGTRKDESRRTGCFLG